MKIEFSPKIILEKISEVVEIEFLSEKGKPAEYIEAVQAAHHILVSIVDTLKELTSDKMALVEFAKMLKLNKYINKDEQFEKFCKDSDMPELLKDLLKVFLKEQEKKHKDCTKDECEHEI